MKSDKICPGDIVVLNYDKLLYLYSQNVCGLDDNAKYDLRIAHYTMGFRPNAKTRLLCEMHQFLIVAVLEIDKILRTAYYVQHIQTSMFGWTLELPEGIFIKRY